MNYLEASQIVQNYIGLDLLESLEVINGMDDEEFDYLPNKVLVSYRILMAGFRKMFNGKI